MSLALLIGHHLCSAAVTHTLLLGQNVVSARLGRFYSCAIAGLIASILFWFELPNVRDSHYARIGVPINATNYEIVAHHARLRMEFQKNGAPDDIADIKRSFEVLTKDDNRRLYDRFGDMELENEDYANLSVIATALAFAYHTLSAIIFAVMFRNKALCISRNAVDHWPFLINIQTRAMYMYSGVGFALEIESRFVPSGTTLKSVYYLNQLLPFEKVVFIRGVAPFLGLLLNIISVLFYTDIETVNTELWKAAVTTNHVIMEKMTDVIDATRHVKSLVPSSGLIKPSTQRNETMQENTSGQSGKNASIEGINDLLQSMDQNQLQKFMTLLKTATAKEDDKKKEGWWNTIRAPLTYFALFVGVKYFFA